MVCECGTVITQDNGLLHCLTLDKLRVANLFHKVWDFRCKRRAALFERVNGCVVGLLSELLDLELFLLAQCLLNSALIELRVVRDNCLLVSVLVVVVVFKLGEPVELRQVLVELLLKQCCPLFGFLSPDLCLFDLSGFLLIRSWKELRFFCFSSSVSGGSSPDGSAATASEVSPVGS